MAPSALPSSPSLSPSPSTPYRILVPEKLSPEGLSLLRSAGFTVDAPTPRPTPDELLRLIPTYHALIVRSETKVTAQVLSAAGPKLRVVARAGVGVDNIDVDAATKKGVVVVNSPSGNIVAAAEHTIALLLATARNVGRADAGMKEGKWERGKLVGVEVGGKTLGVVGFGKVGMKVARMAKGLGMNVVVFDPYASAEVARQAGVELRGELDAVVREVDFLTVHTPLLASTANLLGEKELKSMKPTARVLNVARGGVYNEEALLKALDEGWIAGAGLDVFTSEPPVEGSVAARLAAHPKVVSTPHLGASTVEAQENVSMDVCKQVVTILSGGLPTAAVNAPLILPEEYRRLQPFVKLVERMGSLYTQHFAGERGGMVGGRRFELVYHGELAGVNNTRPLLAALVKGLVSSISDLGGLDVNIVNATLVARERGIAIDEKHVRDGGGAVVPTYASAVTLRSVSTDGSLEDEDGEQVIEGYVSGRAVYISKLGRFTANFQPQGTLLILHNYDEPGKIGNVGMVLGRHGVNISSMQVAPLHGGSVNGGGRSAESDDSSVADSESRAASEALMILGVKGDITQGLVEELEKSEAMNHLSRMSDLDAADLDVAVTDDPTASTLPTVVPSPAPKARSLSDGGATPVLSPSPHLEASSRQSKDDMVLRERDRDNNHSSLLSQLPSTPIRPGFSSRRLSLHMPQREPATPAAAAFPSSNYSRQPVPVPPSPKLEEAYASPTNILPRRSRGLDFSRAATSLHHSTLADQADLDSSPTIGSRAMNIPGRRSGDYGSGVDHTSTSLWSMMGGHDRVHVSSSVGSTIHAVSDSSSSSDDDDYMDEDMDEPYVTTPQVQKMCSGPLGGGPWGVGSPAVSNLLSFQQRQRHRKLPKKKLHRPLGLGFHSPGPLLSKSPPTGLVPPHDMSLHARRESISTAANQLHISGNDSDDGQGRQAELDSPLRPSIVRRAVTRRGNLLPKTKGFARIRAALAEESAPIDAEFRREAEVVRQVRESDGAIEPPHPPPSVTSTALSSPNMATIDNPDDMADDSMPMDHGASGLGLVDAGFRQQVLRNKGPFPDAFSEASSAGAQRLTPPPPGPFGLARATSSAMSVDDISMDSPSASSNGTAGQPNPFHSGGIHATAGSSGSGTPSLPPAGSGPHTSGSSHPQSAGPSGLPGAPAPPTAAEITRRINNSKRRRGDDDLDPISIKRRAVSPSLSIQNSPVMQSPLQRDAAPWGVPASSSSRPGSVGGDSNAGGLGSGAGYKAGSGASENGSIYGGSGGRKARVGLQGMVETNDGITRLSIE
ncbi:hypothetical protein VTJ49DRAFT_3762 [Mycothermus thermophilus]|uniref:D-3-phosphoglycerate dehydrogenase n=1 Tax=Humicola insolens TaxID=85995 RepID=A0ABR3V6R9_HUMIN